jgi:predicted RNA binding protein YcfA (HicA-like mRNA interferase family)
MSKAEKLATKILSGKSDKNFDFDDLCYVLARAGFETRSGRGSHRIYYKDGVVEIIAAQWKSETISGKTGARTAFKV